MILLNAAELCKSYTEKPLLADLSFSINEGDKIGLIGVNGTGKSTLLRIAAGVEEPDSGSITLTRGVRIAWLPQSPQPTPGATVLEQALSYGARSADDSDAFQCKAMLQQLDIARFDEPVDQLSGGERKRVAMAGIFSRPSDILILDEPTNHIDSDTVEWLEHFLSRYKGAILMVTHDRYFLDRVANTILELCDGSLYRHQGNYEAYLEGKAAREEMALATERKRQSLYRRELAWIRRGAQARSTKAQARIDRFNELENSRLNVDNTKLELASAASRLGRKIIELSHISKAYGDRTLIDDFSYTVLRGDRIGILGPNGCGKSTLLKLILGQETPDSGTVDIGETVRIGYFSQENEHMNEAQRVIDYVQAIAYNVQTEDGVVTASQMLERFLFPSAMHSIPTGRLSGGERRRLYLLGILMKAPNVLLLDEPTNDLDIDTLTVLEDYLDSFPGAVIAVSHDRYFLDRISIRTFAYEEDGSIGHYPGGYSDYMEIRRRREKEKEAAAREAASRASSSRGGSPAAGTGDGAGGQAGGAQNASGQQPSSARQPSQKQKLKFSYKEQREFDTIDEEIASLEQQLSDTEDRLKQNLTDYVELQRLGEEKQALEQALEQKMERWVYLNDLAEQIEAQKRG